MSCLDVSDNNACALVCRSWSHAARVVFSLRFRFPAPLANRTASNSRPGVRRISSNTSAESSFTEAPKSTAESLRKSALSFNAFRECLYFPLSSPISNCDCATSVFQPAHAVSRGHRVPFPASRLSCDLGWGLCRILCLRFTRFSLLYSISFLRAHHA